MHAISLEQIHNDDFDHDKCLYSYNSPPANASFKFMLFVFLTTSSHKQRIFVSSVRLIGESSKVAYICKDKQFIIKYSSILSVTDLYNS